MRLTKSQDTLQIEKKGEYKTKNPSSPTLSLGFKKYRGEYIFMNLASSQPIQCLTPLAGVTTSAATSLTNSCAQSILSNS